MIIDTNTRFARNFLLPVILLISLMLNLCGCGAAEVPSVPEESAELSVEKYMELLNSLQGVHGISSAADDVIKVELDKDNFFNFFEFNIYYTSAEKNTDGVYCFAERSWFYRLKDGFIPAAGYPEPVVSVNAITGGHFVRWGLHDYDLDSWNMGMSLEETGEDSSKLRELTMEENAFTGYETLADAFARKNGASFRGIFLSCEYFALSDPVYRSAVHRGSSPEDVKFFDATGTLYLTLG